MAKLRPSWSSSFLGLLIPELEFPDVKLLGSGSDASVSEVVWNGTSCAAKRLHETLLQDQSDGGVEKLIHNFQAECLTWSKLRHPSVVQFLGVYLDRRSRMPVLVMEKMDTSLRTHLERHTKEEFPLYQKAFVLRQVTQAMAYLHSQDPSLVHHDLSTNNVLLNLVSFVTKISDFGMSRAINPSVLTRRSSIKGTLAFMAPEALQEPPRYNEKLDVFSFGNVVLHTLTHEWPVPGGPPNRYEGGMFVGITEVQRRGQSVKLLTAQEEQLFFPVIRRCLENRPDKRPSSLELVHDLIRIESFLPADDQLHQQLSAMEKECRQKDEVIREKDKLIKEMDKNLMEKDAVISTIQLQLNAKEEEYRKRDEVISETFQAQKAEIRRLRDQLELHPKVR